jgi:hypothetical protein
MARRCPTHLRETVAAHEEPWDTGSRRDAGMRRQMRALV